MQEFATRSDVNRADPALLDVLTEREREVLEQVARGSSNREIADELNISPSTAKTHVSRVLMKFDARDRAQLVLIATTPVWRRPADRWRNAPMSGDDSSPRSQAGSDSIVSTRLPPSSLAR
jgi:DNA-binding CsgD family transcriptional regulator